jgi:amino acid permease
MKAFLKLLAFIVGIILAIMTDYSLISQHGRLHFIILGGFIMYFLVEVIFWQFYLLKKATKDLKKLEEKQ